MSSLPRHSKSKNVGTKSSKGSGRGWAGLKPKDLENLSEQIKEKFHWEHIPRPFQLDAIKAQLLRKDVLIHAGTGSGKTTVAAGPYALEATKGMVTFMVSPLIALQDEQVLTFQREFGVSAIAVNSVQGGCTKDIMKRICAGEWRIVLISPEIMLSSNFISNVLHNSELIPRILSIIVDEAHVVSIWGASFRKEYGRIGMIRAQLPKGTPIVAMSATLSPRIRRDVLKKLQINEKDYVSLDIGNDRPNISLVVRAMQNTMNSFSDLDFVVPNTIKEKEDIPKTMIYSDQINDAANIETRINDRLPEHLRDTGLIRPYSAAFSPEHRAQLMDLFKSGEVRVLICTDAAGMGCNTLDVDVVVQWKLPATVSTFVQRAGRAARDPTRTGLAVLLVERSVYEADLSKLDAACVKSENKAKGIRQSSTYPKAPKGYAISRGVQRGSSDGFNDEIVDPNEVPLDLVSLDEGLYTLVQTGACRRKVLTQIYQNATPNPTVACCDLCEPKLLNRTRPGPPDKTPKKTSIKTGLANERVKTALFGWRKNVWEEDFADAIFGPSSILHDETVELLSSVGPILCLKELERVVGTEWPWFGTYGNKLLDRLIELDIPPMQPKPPQKRGEKRTAVNIDVAEKGKESTTTKKSRTQTTVSTTLSPRNPTPVNHGQLSSSQPPLHIPGFPPTFVRYPYLQHMNYSSPIGQPYYATPQRPGPYPPLSTPYYYQTSTPATSSSFIPSHYPYIHSSLGSGHQTPANGPLVHFPHPDSSHHNPGSDS